MAKAKRRTTVAKRKVAKRGRPVSLSARAKRAAPQPRLTGASHAVSGLRAYAAGLVAQRAELDTKIHVVEEALRVMGSGAPVGRAAVRKSGRPRAGSGPRPGSLKDHILQTLGHGNVMSVKEIAAGVVTTGYKSKNKTLAKSVGIALTELRGVRRIARGKFRLK